MIAFQWVGSLDHKMPCFQRGDNEDKHEKEETNTTEYKVDIGKYLFLPIWKRNPSFQLHCTRSLQSCLNLCDLMDHSPLGSSVHEIFPARILKELPRPSPGDLPDLGIEPMSPASPVLQVGSLPAKPSGSPSVAIR